MPIHSTHTVNIKPALVLPFQSLLAPGWSVLMLLACSRLQNIEPEDATFAPSAAPLSPSDLLVWGALWPTPSAQSCNWFLSSKCHLLQTLCCKVPRGPLIWVSFEPSSSALCAPSGKPWQTHTHQCSETQQLICDVLSYLPVFMPVALCKAQHLLQNLIWMVWKWQRGKSCDTRRTLQQPSNTRWAIKSNCSWS